MRQLTAEILQGLSRHTAPVIQPSQLRANDETTAVLLSSSCAATAHLAVNDDSQYRPFRETSLWLGHNTDTSWVPDHTTQHQKVQQPHIYKFSKTNNLD